MQLTANTITRAIERATRPIRVRVHALRFRWYIYQIEHAAEPSSVITLGADGDANAAAAALQRSGAAYVADLDGNALMR